MKNSILVNDFMSLSPDLVLLKPKSGLIDVLPLMLDRKEMGNQEEMTSGFSD